TQDQRIDWFDLLAVQGTLKSVLQKHSSKASLFCYSAFVMVQVLHLYMTTGKTIALTIWTFINKMMSLLFNM
uniref:Myotubularin related protein 8 n=1 Tax=Ovis aries TaxID=9940 RepID=A0AC11CUU3_SHEEP